MEEERFGNALARAQELMLDESFSQKVEGIASAYSGKNKGSYGSSGDLSALEAQAFGASYGQEKPVQMLRESGKRTSYNMEKSKLPKVVLESVKQMPLMSGGEADPNPGLSSMMSRMTEQRVPQAQPQPVQHQSGGIDYSLIKSIIDESVSRHLKGRLDEGASLGGVRISRKGIIQYVDSKGNLYEGVLKLKKAAGTK